MIESGLKKLVKLIVYGGVFVVGAVLVFFGVQNKHTVSKGGMSVQTVYADAPGGEGDVPSSDESDDDGGDGDAG
jgi:hypothetical protein